VDQAAMMAAVEAGGTYCGVLADSLTKAAVSGKHRAGIRENGFTWFPDPMLDSMLAMQWPQ